MPDGFRLGLAGVLGSSTREVAVVESVVSRPSWDDYFLDIAHAVARRSTCLRQPEGVGAVLVRDNRILSTGYAGSLRGQPHCTDEGVGCLIDEVTGGCVRTVHAEQNAFLQAAQHGVAVSGATLYSMLSPCWPCFQSCVNGGIVRVVYRREYRVVERQRQYAAECGVAWEQKGKT